MKNKILNLIAFGIINLLFISAIAQPCLSGWQYRSEVAVVNSPLPLSNHQVSLTVNTQALIALGKIRVDGGDIRFLDANGNTLSYWYDPSELNTSSTKFWIRTNVVGGNSNIYMFYGNPTSPAVASGQATFEFFDTFNTGGISPLKWDKCGNNSNVNVVGGTATLQSNAASPTTDFVITSLQTFSSVVVAEMKVNSANNGRAIIGLADNANNGYATVFENSGSPIMKMMKISTGGPCKLFENITTTYPYSGANGIFGFVWSGASQQKISYPNTSQIKTNSDKVPFFGAAKKIVVGCALNTAGTSGSVVVDYVRVRKYAATEPILTIGTEHESPVNPSATNSGPYCGGSTIVLNTNSYSGAVYAWSGPSGYTSTAQNPTIVGATPALSGAYTVNITMPGGCSASNVSTNVLVSSASNAGAISGATTLCEGFNSGTLNLAGETGNILRWEMSNSTGGPWVTLSNTTNTMTYQNLSDTAYYRSVVQSIGCPEDISAPLQINIDKETVGGFTIGTNSVCDGLNGGDVNLVYESGDILKWEATTDGVTWNDITSTQAVQTYTNLATTTTYRAQVKSGVCPAFYSTETTITVNPNPVALFNATSVCEGFSTQFTDNSTLSTGSIVDFSWNFDNGSGSISQNPLNQYASDGSYVVQFTVVSDKGCSNTASQVVQVNANPNVEYNYLDVCLGFPMNFQSVVSVPGSSVSNLAWDLGDGNTSIQPNFSHTYATASSYDVQLIATSAQGCKDSITKTVYIAQPVTVDFIADSVCLGEPIDFANTSIAGSPLVQYSWNFGDGNLSALQSPSHTYSAKGVYAVILQATLPGSTTSCQSSKTLNVEIYERPTANFSFNDECLSDTVSFVNQTIYTGGLINLTHQWNFDDGNLSNAVDTVHNYLLPGLYDVSLDVATIFGCTSTTAKQVEIFVMPNASFTAASVCYPDTTLFINTSIIPVGNMTYEWDFGNTYSATNTSPNHQYTADGNYQVELITTSNNGCKDTAIQTYTILPKPLAKFVYDEVCYGLSTPFQDSSIINTGTINTYNWDFGDGASAGGTNPQHLYLNVGSYNVNLSVVSDQGCVHDTTIVAVVHPNPIANFDITDACNNFAVQFANNASISQGTISNQWEFGDGGTSNQSDPSHVYNAVNLYNVKLLVTSGEGCQDSIQKYAEVFASPVFDLGDNDTISLGDAVELIGNYNGALAYSWTPGEGLDNNSNSNPMASPLTNTTYVLEITDGNGCLGTDEIEIFVLDDFKLNITNVLTPDGNGLNDTWVVGNIESYEFARVYIYDRWGIEVLNTTNYQNDWEGVSGTDQLPDGTYYYIITTPGIEKIYKGALTILRNK